jgi:hypothetical protein
VNEKAFDDLVPSRNRAAADLHRRQVRWQITIPMVLFGLIVITVGGYLIASAGIGSPTGLWRDVALIWLLVLSMLAALIPLALLAGLTYGLIRLIGILPEWTYKLQRLVEQAADAAAGLSRVVSAPLIRINAFSAGLRQLLIKGTARKPVQRIPDGNRR